MTPYSPWLPIVFALDFYINFFTPLILLNPYSSFLTDSYLLSILSTPLWGNSTFPLARFTFSISQQLTLVTLIHLISSTITTFNNLSYNQHTIVFHNIFVNSGSHSVLLNFTQILIHSHLAFIIRFHLRTLNRLRLLHRPTNSKCTLLIQSENSYIESQLFH